MQNVLYETSRIKNFIDAIFSIALTILILEISLPRINDPTITSLGSILYERQPQFIGYIVSFWVIALFWLSHVRNFRYARSIDHKLIMINLINLFFVVLLPFSTGLYVNNFGNATAFSWYSINIAILGLISAWMIRYIYNSELNNGELTKPRMIWYTLNGLNVFVIWALSAALSDVYPWIARGLFIMIFINESLLTRYWSKRVLDTNR